jgi:peptidyl-prolyl cis-trans isomerase A (cyclophilin A)
MRTVVITLALLTATIAGRGNAQTPDTTARAAWVRSASGLEYRVVAEGWGRRVERGDTVTIHEALSLPDGRTVFDSRVAPNQPVTFTLGANQVIRGVEEGVTCMRVGERRRLRVPPALDGRTFDPAFIPPAAIRLYDIEVLAARP